MKTPAYLTHPHFAAIPWLVHGFGTRAGSPGDFGRNKKKTWPGFGVVELKQTHSDVLYFIDGVCDVCDDQVVFDDRVDQVVFDDRVDRGPGLRPGVHFRHTRPRIQTAGEWRAEGAALDAVPARRLEGDALATDRRGILLVIRTADCLPVLLADEKRKVVAAVHAGWRGTSLGILARVVRELGERYGVFPSSLKAVLGPCIGPACYEVGEDVRTSFREAGRRGDAAVFRAPGSRRRAASGKYLLDLRAANRLQLAAAGVRPDAVFDIPLCTHCDGRLLSYRRDRDTTARLYTFIGIRPVLVQINRD